MRNFLLYFAGFLVVLMLQEFLLSGINIFSLLNIYLYLMIIIMLPVQMASFWVLICSLLVGAVMDVFSGTSAMITICLLAVGFVRKPLINLIIDSDMVVAGGAPFSRRIGTAPFLRFTFILSFIYALLYFTLEMMTFDGFFFTLLRAIVSSIATTFLIYIVQLPLRQKNG